MMTQVVQVASGFVVGIETSDAETNVLHVGHANHNGTGSTELPHWDTIGLGNVAIKESSSLYGF